MVTQVVEVLPESPEGFLPWVEHDGGERPIPWAKAGEWGCLYSERKTYFPPIDLDPELGDACKCSFELVTHYTIRESFPPERMKDFIGEMFVTESGQVLKLDCVSLTDGMLGFVIDHYGGSPTRRYVKKGRPALPHEISKANV